MSRSRRFSESSRRASMTYDPMTNTETARLLENGDVTSAKNKNAGYLEEALLRQNGSEKVRLFCSYRFNVIVCCMLSMMINFASQASMTSAFVCMLEDDVDDDDPNYPDVMPAYLLTNATYNVTDDDADDKWIFNYDKTTQGFVLSSYFIGYYLSQLPAGMLAARFGPKKIVVIGLILESILQILAVPAALLGVEWLYVDRVTAGLVDGLLYAPTFALVGQWTPRFETSILFGIAGIGMELGNMYSFSISTVACEIDFQGGWPIVFYTLGVSGFIIAILFIVFVSDSPFDNRLITKRELDYMAPAIPKLEEKDNDALSRIPVKEILRSMPVWAIVVGQIGTDWLYYMLISVSPQYLEDVIKLSDFEVNLLSGLPFIAIIPSIYLAGHVSDRLVTNGTVSNTTVRKVCDTICKIFPALTLVGFCYLPEGSVAGAFALNTFGAIALGFAYVSWMANPVDLAPAYTGFVVGVCEVGAIWVAIVVPLFVENLTKENKRSQWQFVYLITAGLQVVTNIFYWIFASGELQPWALSTYEHSYDVIPDGSDSKEHTRLRSRTMSGSSSLPSVGDDKKDLRLLSKDLERSLSEQPIEEREEKQSSGEVVTALSDGVPSGSTLKPLDVSLYDEILRAELTSSTDNVSSSPSSTGLQQPSSATVRGKASPSLSSSANQGANDNARPNDTLVKQIASDLAATLSDKKSNSVSSRDGKKS